MSNAMERIKNKIRNSSGASVHTQLIDTSGADAEPKAESYVNVYENENKHVSEHAIENVNVNANAAVDHAASQGGPQKREKRKKFEELYKRDTFWIRNELKEKLDAYCQGERGEKTRIVNEALKDYLEKLP
ncbi:hypothetical protein [Paenibacillus sp.]|uniref:hypothetical protein n=1 Tax=Paenibacillus sp. TaxID=58172 RepID=UPI00281231D9|nr:hypothetical protein [Paenibacillus sp.]